MCNYCNKNDRFCLEFTKIVVSLHRNWETKLLNERIEIETPAKILRYIVEKGSITIDGISLTVAKLTDSSFAVSVIPHTGEETTLLNRNPGDIVNLENDIVGKYVERLMNFKTDDRDNKSEERNNSDSITMNFLNENGFY